MRQPGEIRYWLCHALARERDSRFELEIRHIDGADYKFLYGFYNRMRRNFDTALKFYREALLISPNFNRAKRELVNVLLSKGLYNEALETARQNYNKIQTNPFHIQAYFICLVRKQSIFPADVSLLKSLLEGIKRTNDVKADELYSTMMGEYEFYVNRDTDKAINVLTESLSKSEHKYYPFKALYEIYLTKGQYNLAEELKERYEKEHYVINSEGV